MTLSEIAPDARNYLRLFGLIGYPLSHSFSKRYFSQKFANEGIVDAYYELFPLKSATLLPDLLQSYPNLKGLNVTIPYKQQVLPYLNDLDPEASAVGAVNTIKIENGRLTGYNTDVYGFERSLREFIEQQRAAPKAALVLGTGGAARAVCFVLQKLGITYKIVSRQPEQGDYTYATLPESTVEKTPLIINTTPLGMVPDIETFPDIPYHCLSKSHLLYDLVYNPATTAFLEKGKREGAATINGLPMLYWQAERAWAIWNDLE